MGNLIEDPALRDRLHVFEDRTSAGQQLAAHLSGYRGQEIHLFAIPAGGVPVAVEIGRALSIPLDHGSRFRRPRPRRQGRFQ